MTLPFRNQAAGQARYLTKTQYCCFETIRSTQHRSEGTFALGAREACFPRDGLPSQHNAYFHGGITAMPLPADEKIVALSNQILQKFEAVFGAHPGFRPAHAKGIMLNGSFTPTPEAASLSKAPNLNRPTTPATVRFS